MAVLRSFELKGNKQSFANWISNLSPAEVPFTSMIGKEGIDQAQYSWQTDALAPPSTTLNMEGSLVEFQPRASTEVITNFTSILRKVVKLSDTNAATVAWGRRSEEAYQLGKAGKEILRDLEFMNLNQVDGNSAAGQPGRFAGFEGLVAGKNTPCPDTGAVVHKEITIADGLFTAIDKADLFDMTYQLYLSGSKANKIMFHPKHAQAFAALVASNASEPLTYRMFDGLSDKYNAQINRIRDPLCREYDLIPNRYMPENKIYFFNEKDWTQMVLREPKIVKLSKTGSTNRKMVEMEVGLRHIHPYASGILALNSVTITNTTFPSKDKLTAGVGDSSLVTADISVNTVAEKDLLVTWHTSNPNIVDFLHPQQFTNDQGRAINYLRGGPETGVARIWSVCRGVKSDEYEVTVLNPLVEFEVDDSSPAAGQDIALTATVKKHDGTAVGAGVLVRWYHNPDFNFTFASETSLTNATGVATVNAVAINDNPTIMQAVVNGVPSEQYIVNYVPTSDVVGAPVLTSSYFSIGGTVTATVTVIDHEGNPLEDALVTWNHYPYGRVDLEKQASFTDKNGEATVVMTGVGVGKGFISATCEGVSSDPTPYLVDSGFTIRKSIDKTSTSVGGHFHIDGLVGSVSGVPIEGATVRVISAPDWPTPIGDAETNAEGRVSFDIEATQDGTYEFRLQLVGSDPLVETSRTVVTVVARP